jgi:hypothetical protein
VPGGGAKEQVASDFASVTTKRGQLDGQILLRSRFYFDWWTGKPASIFDKALCVMPRTTPPSARTSEVENAASLAETRKATISAIFSDCSSRLMIELKAQPR